MTLVMGDTVGARLRELREEVSKIRGRRLTQREMAKDLGVNEDTYRSYEYDKATLPKRLAEEIGKRFGKPWKWLYEGDEEIGLPGIPIPQALPMIPCIGPVGANVKVDWFDPLESEEMVEVPPEMAGRGRFCAVIHGDSCYDLVHPGDLGVFQRHDAPKLGQMVLHRSNDGRLTLKQLRHDGERFMLHPLNPRYEDEPADGAAFGYLVGLVREVGSRKITIYDPHGIRP